MMRIPFSSTVLQRRRGYRRVLRHFSRIRLAPTIPLEKDGMRDLLELKNIALLYELWTFFRLVHEISAVLGSPPVRSGRPASDLFQTAFAAGGTFEWDPGVRVMYNQRFSRSPGGTRVLLFRAADSRHRTPDRGRVRSSVRTSTRCTPIATRFRTPGRCGSCTRVWSFGSSEIRVMRGRLAAKRFLRQRGCRERSRGWGRFRWGRWLEERGSGRRMAFARATPVHWRLSSQPIFPKSLPKVTDPRAVRAGINQGALILNGQANASKRSTKAARYAGVTASSVKSRKITRRSDDAACALARSLLVEIRITAHLFVVPRCQCVSGKLQGILPLAEQPWELRSLSNKLLDHPRTLGANKSAAPRIQRLCQSPAISAMAWSSAA